MPSTPDPLRPRHERLADVYRRAGRHQRRRQAVLGAAAVAILLPALAAVTLQGGDGETTLVADAPTSTTSSSTTLITPSTTTTTTTAETTASTVTTSTAAPAAEADPEETPGTAPPATTTTTTAATTPTTTTPPPVDHGAQLRDRSFRSTSVTEGGQPKPLVEGTRIDVQLARERADDLIRWRSGCNFAGASVTVTADRLDITTNGASSAMGCTDERSDQESWVNAFFGSNPYWVSQGARLTLTSGDTVIELEEIPFDDYGTSPG